MPLILIYIIMHYNFKILYFVSGHQESEYFSTYEIRILLYCFKVMNYELRSAIIVPPHFPL